MGACWRGADAAPEILRRVPQWRWLAGVFAVPGVRPIARGASDRVPEVRSTSLRLS
ncbi:MAG: DUF393 domain-containing protein [Candidatus Rokubacteria bacterium]|nr:DUF393 domain-containing protein [Candidatus Rokubacteria bacterium]